MKRIIAQKMQTKTNSIRRRVAISLWAVIRESNSQKIKNILNQCINCIKSISFTACCKSFVPEQRHEIG